MANLFRLTFPPPGGEAACEQNRGMAGGAARVREEVRGVAALQQLAPYGSEALKERQEEPRAPRAVQLQRVDALGDQAALDEVLGVGELDARVADRGAAKVAQDARVLTALLVDNDVVAGEQAVVAVLVGDDLDVGGDLGVALDEVADGGGQAGGEAARGEQGDATN